VALYTRHLYTSHLYINHLGDRNISFLPFISHLYPCKYTILMQDLKNDIDDMRKCFSCILRIFAFQLEQETISLSFYAEILIYSYEMFAFDLFLVIVILPRNVLAIKL